MYDEILMKLNKKAIKKGEVPVSCIIVYKNKIIAKAYNKRITKNDPIAHAEIIAIRKAAKKLKTWNLNDCELYVTLKPCKMCSEIIKESRIKIVYYILNSEKEINNKIEYIEYKTPKYIDFKEQIKKFFKDKR